jgi:hypothetical protein
MDKSSRATKKDGDRKVYEYRSPAGLGRFLVVLILLYVAVNVAESIAAIRVISLLRGLATQFSGFDSFMAGKMMLMARGRLQAFAEIIELLVLVTACVTSCFWIHRAACNSRALGAKGIEDTPGWAVGWFFVPFANLVKPFLAISQIFLSSIAPSNWQGKPAPPFLYVWWVTWLLGHFYSIAVLVSMASPKSIDDVVMKYLFLLGGHVMQISGALMFLAVTVLIGRAQVAQHNRYVCQ